MVNRSSCKVSRLSRAGRRAATLQCSETSRGRTGTATSANVSIASLPLELLDQVFHMLQATELKHCSLVCRWWKSTTRSVLFEHACFDSVVKETGEERLEDFGLFTQSTHLFGFIKHLRLDFRGPDSLDVEELRRFLVQLTKLRSLNLKAFNLSHTSLSVSNSLRSRPRRGASKVITVDIPRVTVAVFSQIDAACLASFLGCFSRVDELILDNALLDIKDTGDLLLPKLEPSVLAVQHLTINYVWDYYFPRRSLENQLAGMALLHRLLDHTALLSAEGWIYGKAFVATNSEFVYPRLKRVSLGSQFTRPLNFSLFPSIQNIDFGVLRVEIQQNLQLHYPSWLVVGQALLESPLTLRKATVAISIANWGNPREDPKELFLDLQLTLLPTLVALDWALFGQAIDRHQGLSELHVFILVGRGDCDQTHAEIVEAVTEAVLDKHFSSPRARDIIRFEVREPPMY